MNPEQGQVSHDVPGQSPKLDALGRARSPDKAGQGLRSRLGSSRPFGVLGRTDQGLLTGQSFDRAGSLYGAGRGLQS